MSIDFHDGDTDHTILKLCNDMQTSPLSLHAKLSPETIVFFGKAFGEHQVPIKFASLAQVEVSAYARMVPTKSAGLAIPSSISNVALNLETMKLKKYS